MVILRQSKSSLVLVVVMLVVSFIVLASNNSFAFMSPFVTSKRVHFKYDLPTLAQTILDAHGGAAAIQAKGSFPSDELATTNEGMYALADDDGMSYFFRGAVYDNWVHFAGYYWRIIRVNGDGNVRMIYSGSTAPTSSTKTVMTGTGTQTTTISYHTSSSNVAYQGYMFTTGSTHGYGTNSNIKGHSTNGVDKWYQSHLASYSSYLADSIFCCDRGGFHWSARFTCPDAGDRFTVSTSRGNGALTYPIGLITADELNAAGSLSYVPGESTTAHYLYTGQGYWTMSSASTSSAQVYILIGASSNGGGYYGNVTVTGTYGIRPVINLKGDLPVTGTGAYNDPYMVT